MTPEEVADEIAGAECAISALVIAIAERQQIEEVEAWGIVATVAERRMEANMKGMQV